jgi:hypothetical protein
MSSGSSGNRVMIPEPSFSIFCLMRRIVLVVRLRALESSGMRGRCGAPLTFQIARNSIQFAADRTRREDICRDIYIFMV